MSGPRLRGLSATAARGGETGPARVRAGPGAGWARPGLTAGVLFVLGALLSGITILHGLNPNDEGLVLQAADRIVHGQLPYRDFYANYGPGQYFTIAGLQALFGPSLLAWRVLRVLLDATVGVLAYRLARRDAPEGLALLAWLGVAGAMAFPSIPSPNPPAIALSLGALLLVRRRPGLAGALAGLALAYRVDAGLATILGAMLAAFGAGGRRAAFRLAGAAMLVGGLLLAPVILASPRDFWDQTIGFGLHQQGLQRLPLPGAHPPSSKPSELFDFYFAYVLLAGTALWLALALRARAPARVWALAPVVLAGVAYLLARADEFHLIPLAVFLPVALVLAAAGERAAGHRVAALACVAVLGLIALHGLDRKRVQLATTPPLAALHLPVADGVRIPWPDARALERLHAFVDRRVASGAPLFVAQPRYDLVKVGDPLLYVLLGHPNPTRYDVMQPGVVTTAPVQRDMIRALARARPRLVVRWLDPVAEQPEPDGAGRSSGVNLLGRFLDARYRSVARFGDYEVLRRR